LGRGAIRRKVFSSPAYSVAWFLAPWVMLVQSIGSVHSVLGAKIIHGVLAFNKAIKSVPGRWPYTGRPCQGAPYGWRYALAVWPVISVM